jgi:dihydropteroate synthase
MNQKDFPVYKKELLIERIGEFYASSALEACREICKKKMISQISHALDIGIELGKAEIAIKDGRKYVQDKELE